MDDTNKIKVLRKTNLNKRFVHNIYKYEVIFKNIDDTGVVEYEGLTSEKCTYFTTWYVFRKKFTKINDRGEYNYNNCSVVDHNDKLVMLKKSELVGMILFSKNNHSLKMVTEYNPEFNYIVIGEEKVQLNSDTAGYYYNVVINKVRRDKTLKSELYDLIILD